MTTTEELARALYRAHGPALARWARRRFVDAQLADDIVQEVIVQAWRKYDQYDPQRGPERAWIFGIARNVGTSRLRQASAAPVPVDTPLDTGIDDEELDRMIDRSLILDGMDSLSDEHQQVVVAAFWDRQTTREIAERFDIPDGTVKSRLHYALVSLRAALDTREDALR